MENLALVGVLVFSALTTINGLLFLRSESKVERLERELAEAREKLAAQGSASSP